MRQCRGVNIMRILVLTADFFITVFSISVFSISLFYLVNLRYPCIPIESYTRMQFCLTFSAISFVVFCASDLCVILCVILPQILSVFCVTGD